MHLVSVTTSDRLRLHGAYQTTKSPNRVADSKGKADAVILVHGIGGNFYSSRLLLQTADWLRQLGLATLLINTRGHDMVNLCSWNGRAKSVGAAFEVVDDCRHDLSAWADYLQHQGHQKIVLLGHSLGAIKSLYLMAHQPHPAISTVVGISPTRLSYQRMLDSSSRELFQTTYQRCQDLAAAGAGEQPIQVDFPVSTWISPNAYLRKYGPQELYNWSRFINQIEIPTLLVFGEKELAHDKAFAGLSQELKQLSGTPGVWNAIAVDIIEQADHFYSGVYQSLFDSLTRWLTN